MREYCVCVRQVLAASLSAFAHGWVLASLVCFVAHLLVCLSAPFRLLRPLSTRASSFVWRLVFIAASSASIAVMDSRGTCLVVEVRLRFEALHGLRSAVVVGGARRPLAGALRAPGVVGLGAHQRVRLRARGEGPELAGALEAAPNASAKRFGQRSPPITGRWPECRHVPAAGRIGDIFENPGLPPLGSTWCVTSGATQTAHPRAPSLGRLPRKLRTRVSGWPIFGAATLGSASWRNPLEPSRHAQHSHDEP